MVFFQGWEHITRWTILCNPKIFKSSQSNGWDSGVRFCCLGCFFFPLQDFDFGLINLLFDDSLKEPNKKPWVETSFFGLPGFGRLDVQKKLFFFFGHVKKYTYARHLPGPGFCILDSPKGRDGIIWHTQTGRIQVEAFCFNFGDGTPLKTNMSPENQWVGRCISYWNSPFWADMLVLGGVPLQIGSPWCIEHICFVNLLAWVSQWVWTIYCNFYEGSILLTFILYPKRIHAVG